MNLQELPKVELHRHLELSLRQSTITELAPSIGIEINSEEDYKNHFLITEPMSDLESVLNKFLDTQRLLNSTEILERITYEACEDAFKKEGIRILELRYAPTFVNMNHDHLNFESIHEAIVKGMKKAESEFDMAIGLICIIQRILPIKDAEAVTQFAIDHNDTFIGLDLADNEVGFDSKPFAPFFSRAKEAGLGITSHSGEANVPKAPRYVKDAIEYLGAERIGHGVQIYRDEDMMNYVKENNVVLELCPTSNWLTNAVPSVAEHPFRKLMEFGVKTTINSDDPGIFGIDLIHELEVLKNHHQFTESEFKSCMDTAAQASFISEEKKQRVYNFEI